MDEEQPAVTSSAEAEFEWYTSVPRRERLRSSTLPPDLVRGVTTRVLLARCGKVFRKRPDSLPLDTQKLLFDLSSPTNDLAFFLSHVWNSPGWQKYIALSLHFLDDSALVGGGLAALAVLLSQWYLFGMRASQSPGNSPSYTMDRYHEASQWELLAGMIVLWSVLLVGHYFLRFSRGFLDCACIHQTDIEKKTIGITHLGSFLRVSKKLLICWDAEYLKRGWCVYELATFLALNPEGSLQMLPLRMYVVKLSTHIIFSICHGAYFYLEPLLTVAVTSTGTHCVAAVLLAIAYAFGCVLGIYVSEWCWKDVMMLQWQLDGFDFRNTCVKVKRDQSTILKSILRMYPDGGVEQFNNVVQTKVKEILLREFSKQRCPISYRHALFVTFPFVCSSLGSCEKAGVSLPLRMTFLICGITHAFAVVPVLLAMCMRWAMVCIVSPAVGARAVFACRIRGGVTLALITALFWTIAFLFTSVAAGENDVLGMKPWHGVLGATLLALPAWSLCVWFYWPVPLNGYLNRFIGRSLNGYLNRYSLVPPIASSPMESLSDETSGDSCSSESE